MDLKKILAAATALACLTAPALAVDAGATGGLSISPHAVGVCAPNTPIVQEDAPVAVGAVEPARVPVGPVWFDIPPWDVPGHVVVVGGANYEDDGTTLRIWNSRSCLNCGYTETIGEVECVPVENGPECVEPEDTDAEEYHNDPATDEEIQAALETFDPTIDDPQYQREYERYQRDHGNQEEAEDVGSPVLYEETDDETC